MSTLSVCLITKDEEHYLQRSISRIASIAYEIIVVDTGSLDRTKAIALEQGAKLFTFTWTGSFSEARNFAQDKASGNWILVIDADMAIEQDDVAKISDLLADKEIEGYFLKTRSYLGTEPGGEYIDDYSLLLFRNRDCYRFQGVIHEEIVSSIRTAGFGKIQVADVLVHHYGYLEGAWEGKAKTARNLEIIKAAISQNPRDVTYMYYLGSELMGLDQYSEALNEFLAVAGEWTQLVPQYSDVIKKIGICYLALGEYDASFSFLRQGVELFPDYTDLWMLLGQQYLRTNNCFQAQKCFQRCIKLGKPPAKYATASGVGTYLPYLEYANVKVKQALKIFMASSKPV